MKRPVLLLTVFILAVTIVGLTAMVDHSIYASDRDQPWISCSAVMEAGESYSRSIDIVIYNQTGSPLLRLTTVGRPTLNNSCSVASASTQPTTVAMELTDARHTSYRIVA